ncbi:MAG: Spy/CpxP family protein refolding chaperone [Spirochaetia bacterium]|nr:Spy/CpxP family protein refolding chaperone [Spirochaetia bacterium]
MKLMKYHWILTAVLFITGAVFFIGQCGGHHKCDLHRPMLSAEQVTKIAENLSEHLNLDETQKQKLFKIRDEVIEKNKSFKPLKENFKEKLLEALKKDKINEAEINKFFEDKEDKRKEHREFFISKLVEIYSILTPDQKGKLIEYLEKHEHKKKHKCEHDE